MMIVSARRQMGSSTPVLRAVAAATAIALVGCADNAGWDTVDAPAAEGVDLWIAQSRGEEIWAMGLEGTLVHYDGATWSRPEAELTSWPVIVAAPDSFWSNRLAEDQHFELLHSTDLVNWTWIDLAAETGLPITSSEILFAEGDSVWVRALTESSTFLLHTRGGDWSDLTPPQLADLGPVGVGGCRRADDDLWITASWRTFDDFTTSRSAHLEGATWTEADLPAGSHVLSCRPGELVAGSQDDLSLAPGWRVYRQDGAAWTEVEFAEEWRAVFDVAPAGAAGELWLLGWSQDLETRLAIPRIWRLDGQRARDTLGGDLGVEILEPRLNGVGALHAIATTDNGTTFAFGEDGLILEYLGH